MYRLDTKRQSINVFLEYLGEQMEKQPDRDEVHLPFANKSTVYEMYLKEVEAHPDVYRSCALGYFEVIVTQPRSCHPA